MTGESHDSGKPPANADKVNTGVAFSFPGEATSIATFIALNPIQAEGAFFVEKRVLDLIEKMAKPNGLKPLLA